MLVSRPLSELILRARDGDPTALGYVYVLEAGHMRSAVSRIVTKSDAEDVVHDLFVGLPNALRFFEYRDWYAFRAWLRRRAVQAALSARRRHRRRITLADDRSLSKIHVPLLTPPSHDVSIDLQRALERLSAGRREVLILHDLHGLTHDEISNVLGISSAASESRLRRARGDLRKFLYL